MQKLKELGPLGIFIVAFGAISWLGFPYWTLAIVAFFGATIFHTTPLKDFAVATAAGSFLWGGVAAWLNWQNGGQFAPKIGEIFQGLTLPKLIFATSTLGGLLAGMGALSGGYFREIFLNEKINE
jgi:hypothetical protein